MGVQTGSAGLENDGQYLARARMHLLHVGEVPEVSLLESYPTETLWADADISTSQRETEAQLTGLALGPTSQLVSVRVRIQTQHSGFRSPRTVFLTCQVMMPVRGNSEAAGTSHDGGLNKS